MRMTNIVTPHATTCASNRLPAVHPSPVMICDLKPILMSSGEQLVTTACVGKVSSSMA